MASSDVPSPGALAAATPEEMATVVANALRALEPGSEISAEERERAVDNLLQGVVVTSRMKERNIASYFKKIY